jgi:SprT-like family
MFPPFDALRSALRQKKMRSTSRISPYQLELNFLSEHILYTRKKPEAFAAPEGPQDASAQSSSILMSIWKALIYEYFPSRLDLLSYEVRWGQRRQKRVLASCNLTKRRVLVAAALCDNRWIPHLSPLLYHELCHAVLGEQGSKTSGAHRWHGREFKELEARHPQIDALNSWIKNGGWTSATRSYSRSHPKRRSSN